MKLKHLPILVILFLLPFAVKADVIDKIAELIKQGNTHELATFFAENVDMNILDESNVYSKAQSEIILDKFFKENRPVSASLLHRIASNANYNFGVVVLTTDKGKFRISFTLKEVNKVMVIIELRIETEKT